VSGSSGSGPFRSRSPGELAKLVRKAQDATAEAGFTTELSGMLTKMLGAFNDRNVELVEERLDEIKLALETSIEGTIDQMFGGSVAKHTYVDGLSDIDSLLFIDESKLKIHSSTEAIQQVLGVLKKHFAEQAAVTSGRLAVTVEYEDGMQIQLLPAVRTINGGVRVPSATGDGWSSIDPEAFQKALTRRNNECGGKLVPTIKLAKAINGTFPESQRLSGYHLESLAVAAFGNYGGPRTLSAMLPHFFEKARDLVLEPIRDKTGQSIHVDDYLGAAKSEQRLNAGHLLDRIAKRMRNSNVAGSLAQWRALFDLDEE